MSDQTNQAGVPMQNQIPPKSTLKPTAKFVKDIATSQIHPTVKKDQDGEQRLDTVNNVFQRKSDGEKDPGQALSVNDPDLIQANIVCQDSKTECLVNARTQGEDKKRDAVIINWFDRLRTRLNG